MLVFNQIHVKTNLFFKIKARTHKVENVLFTLMFSLYRRPRIGSEGATRSKYSVSPTLKVS